ncbi:hypothetical protein GGQ84_000223 [Desulfitispora alkaliphila]
MPNTAAIVAMIKLIVSQFLRLMNLICFDLHFGHFSSTVFFMIINTPFEFIPIAGQNQ